MADSKKLFLGIKQVKKATFEALQDSEKIGYLWFVRDEDAERFEIYLGTRKYGETNSTSEDKIEKIRIALGLTEESMELPESFVEQFGDKNITEVIQDLGNCVEELKETDAELAEQISGLTNELINVEEVVSRAIVAIKDKVGLDNDFNFSGENAKFNNYDSLADALYTKSEIDEKVSGAFHFKGKFDYLSELLASGDTVEGNVYQVVYKDLEDDFVTPIDPPMLVNSEFAYNNSVWVELGPLFDDRELKELKARFDSVGIISDEFIYNLFAGELKHLSVNVILGEALNKTGEGDYHVGTVVRIGVEPVDGSDFIKWDDDNREQYRRVVVIDSQTGNTYNAMIGDNTNSCKIIPAVKSGSEDMGHVEGGGRAFVGETIMISAVRNENTKFVAWYDENDEEVSTDADFEISISDVGEVTYYAQFRSLNVDVILNNLGNVPHNASYASGTITESGVTYEWQNSKVEYSKDFAKTSLYNNTYGWVPDAQYTYENLIYSGSTSEDNKAFVLDGIKHSNNKGKVLVSGNDGLTSVRFNYGYSYREEDAFNVTPDLNLVVKIYTGTTTENDNNLYREYEITRTFDEWGWIGEDDKISQRPFLFDSVTEEGDTYDIVGDYLIVITNYFDGEPSYVRAAIDNIEVSLIEDQRRAARERRMLGM